MNGLGVLFQILEAIMGFVKSESCSGNGQWSILPTNLSGPGRQIDPLFFKGLLQELGILLRHSFSLEPLAPEEPRRLLHPGRSASIWLHGARVGFWERSIPMCAVD